MGVMMLTLSSTLCFSLLLAFGGCSLVPDQRHHRQFKREGNNASVDQTSPSSLRPLFKTNVYSTDGSSSNSKIPNIQTRVYIPQTPKLNLTNRGVLGERPMNHCHSPTATFHYSYCAYRDDPAASINEYVVWCREAGQAGPPPPTYTLPSAAGAMESDIARFTDGAYRTRHDPSLHASTGWCEVTEVCVTAWGFVGLDTVLRETAHCVPKKAFKVFGNSGDSVGGSSSSGLEVSDDAESNHGTGQKQEEAQSGLDASDDAGSKHGTEQKEEEALSGLANSIFAGRVASIVLSKDETSDSALQVEELDLKSWGVDGTSSPQGGGVSSPSIDSKTGSVSGPGTEAPDTPGVLEQQRNCTDCMSLKTSRPLAPDTESLEMEVKMVGAGSVALAGVLWVALLSG